MHSRISPGIDATGPASKHTLAMLRRIEKREWWLWSSVVAVTILSAVGMMSFALPVSSSRSEGFAGFILAHAVHWVFGLVLVSNICVISAQVQIHRIRNQLANQLYELTVLDPLTGLFNRRYVEHRLDEEIARCQRIGSPLTLILLDLDTFKQINDEYGHATGDDVLKAFAERLKAATRGSDVAARYGGDEFLVLLADCKPDGVQYVLGRLSGLHIERNKEKLLVSYSAGWADYIPGDTLIEGLRRADEALYANKRKLPLVR